MTAPSDFALLSPLATVLGVLDTYTLESLDNLFIVPEASRRLMDQALADLTTVVLTSIGAADGATRIDELLRLLYYCPTNPEIYCSIADAYRDMKGGADIAKSFYMMAAIHHPRYAPALIGISSLSETAAVRSRLDSLVSSLKNDRPEERISPPMDSRSSRL